MVLALEVWVGFAEEILYVTTAPVYKLLPRRIILMTLAFIFVCTCE